MIDFAQLCRKLQLDLENYLVNPDGMTMEVRLNYDQWIAGVMFCIRVNFHKSELIKDGWTIGVSMLVTHAEQDPNLRATLWNTLHRQIDKNFSKLLK